VDAKASARRLQRQEYDSVHPFGGLGRGCDEQQLFRSLGGSHGLGHYDNHRALVLLDESREMKGHGPHVMGHEDSVLTRGEGQNLRIGQAS
jgi:hypothetical protein